jgi:hypothetical protein
VLAKIIRTHQMQQSCGPSVPVPAHMRTWHSVLWSVKHFLLWPGRPIAPWLPLTFSNRILVLCPTAQCWGPSTDPQTPCYIPRLSPTHPMTVLSSKCVQWLSYLPLQTKHLPWVRSYLRPPGTLPVSPPLLPPPFLTIGSFQNHPVEAVLQSCAPNSLLGYVEDTMGWQV